MTLALSHQQLLNGSKLFFHKRFKMRNLFFFSAFFFSFYAHCQFVKDTTINGRPFALHTVQPKETLYGLSREYNAELNQIVVQNPSVIQGLKIGVRLQIPLQKQRVQKTIDEAIIPKVISNQKSTIVKKQDDPFLITDSTTINAALLLPFFLDKNDQLELDNLSAKPTSLYPNSSTALAYYSGVLLALDTLQSLGLNIHLKVLDVPNDSVFNTILYSTILDDRALIIGPLLANQFRKLSEKYGSDINRRLVSPLSFKNVIGKYPNTYQFVPFPSLQIDTIVSYLNFNKDNSNMLIVGQESEKKIFNTYQQLFFEKKSNGHQSYLVKKGEHADKEALKEKLNESNNIVLVASTNRSFVARLIPMLASMEDTNFTVFGLNSWNMFTSLDQHDINTLNIHMPSVFYRDDSDLFLSFMSQYVDQFDEYPSRYAYGAYRQALYLLSSKFSHLFDFEKTQHNKGFVNTKFPLIYYQGFKQNVAKH